MNLSKIYDEQAHDYIKLKLGEIITIVEIDRDVSLYGFNIGDKFIVLRTYKCPYICQSCWTNRIVIVCLRHIYNDNIDEGIYSEVNVCGCRIIRDRQFMRLRPLNYKESR